jgi:hypothetical protein
MLNEFRGSQLALPEISKKLNDKSFTKDFFDQCLASIGTFKYADRLKPRPSKFDIYAGSGLNPLSPAGKCQQPQCIIDYAHHFARTACFYADRVVIPDPFSFTYLEATDEEILWSLTVLKILQPLLEAGVIVFGPAAFISCPNCAKVMESEREQVTSQLWREFTNSSPDVFRYKDGRRWRLSFGSPLFMNSGVEFRFTTPATKEAIAATKPDTLLTGRNAMNLVRQYRDVIQKHCAQCANNVVFDSLTAGHCNTTVVTSTPEEAAGYRLLDGRKVGSALPDWSMLRTIRLPALERLTASQALQVRDEAYKALPAFRAKMQRELMSLKDVSDEGEEKRALAAAADLRVAAQELQGQLASLSLSSVRRREKLFGSLAIAFQIVALGSHNPSITMAAMGTFAGLMIAAHRSKSDREEKHEVLVHQPAYVLLTAERIHEASH